MLDVDGSNYVNDPGVELCWAIKSYEYAQTHFKLICSVKDIKELRLTSMDEQIYTEFEHQFPNLNVTLLSEEELKNQEAKTMWREFCNKFTDAVADFNMGTLLRLDASKEYDRDNTCVVPRIQFLAIEVARNRRGINNPEVLTNLR